MVLGFFIKKIGIGRAHHHIEPAKVEVIIKIQRKNTAGMTRNPTQLIRYIDMSYNVIDIIIYLQTLHSNRKALESP